METNRKKNIFLTKVVFFHRARRGALVRLCPKTLGGKVYSKIIWQIEKDVKEHIYIRL